MDNSLTEIKSYSSATKQNLAQKVEVFQKKLSKERNEQYFKKARQQFRLPQLLQDNLLYPFDFEDLEFEEETIHINRIEEIEAELQEYYEQLL